MTDIVERLRARADEQERCNSYPIDRAWDREAAAEIVRLRAENDISDGLLSDARAEIERLQASLKMTNGGERQLSAHLKLEADNERLRAFEWAWGQLSADLREFIASEAPEAARRALEPKP